MMRPSLVVHGGAGAGEQDLRDAQRPGCTAAITAAWRVLVAGGSALDAVCAAVEVLEDDPAFNAGIGSHRTNTGTVEMDASVMDGRTLLRYFQLRSFLFFRTIKDVRFLRE